VDHAAEQHQRVRAVQGVGIGLYFGKKPFNDNIAKVATKVTDPHQGWQSMLPKELETGGDVRQVNHKGDREQIN
jgi:hypothetical protein